MTPRLQNLRRRLSELKLDAILVSNPVNRRYLSGFSGSAGYLFITDTESVLATDFRYIEQAQAEAPEFEILKISAGFASWLPGLISKTKVETIGFESQDTSYDTHQQLVAAARKLPSKARPRLAPTTGMVETLRAIKDAQERELIERAAIISDSAIGYAAKILKEGMTEKQLAWKLERFMRENGSQSMPFEIIAASGPNSALPHAQPTDRPIQSSEPIVIDLGAKVAGYTSDITRTLCLGDPSEKLRQIYRIVHQAQKKAIRRIKAGINGDKADRIAREVIDRAGYAEAFGHGLGHGVGMETHEFPRLGKNASETLQNKMVFTIEPGIYLPGWGGVRIEDMVLLEATGPKTITRAEKYDF